MNEKTIWADDGSDSAVIACLARHVGKGGPKWIALPGGTTPVAILANASAHAVDWTGTHIWPTDEREVPPGHPASNATMLMRGLEGTAAEVHSLQKGETPPAFDLVWLGVGMDGHIASIFPGMTLTDDAPAGVIGVMPDPLPFEAPFARLTLTMRALTNAAEIIIVIRGEAKRTMLEAAFSPGSTLPVARFVSMAPSPVAIYWSAE